MSTSRFCSEHDNSDFHICLVCDGQKSVAADEVEQLLLTLLSVTDLSIQNHTMTTMTLWYPAVCVLCLC